MHISNSNVFIVAFLIIIALFIKIFPIKNKQKVFLITSFLFLFLILILREPYSDMNIYIKAFMDISSFGQIFSYRWEIFYLLLTYFVKIFTSNSRIFMIVLAFLGLIGPYTFLKKYSNNYFFSVIFFIVFGLFSYNLYVVREALALSFIMFFGLKYISENSFFKFLIVIILASCIHLSSIFFIIAYPLSKIKLNKIFWLVYFFLFAFVFVFKELLMNLLYVGYYANYQNIISTSSGYGKLIFFILIALFIYVLCYSKNKRKLYYINDVKNINSLFYKLFLSAIIIQILATQNGAITRLTSYFVIGLPTLIPYCIFKFKDNKTKILICAIMLLCCVLYVTFFDVIEITINL